MGIVSTTRVNISFIHKHELSLRFYAGLLRSSNTGRARSLQRGPSAGGDALMVTLAAATAPDARVEAKVGRDAPIDRGHLARYTFGNRALEIEVLQLFAAQAPHYLEALRAAATEKAWREAAHTLKGSARAVGAFRVADGAERAEALQGNQDAILRVRAVIALEEALAAARSHIAALVLSD